ncbi:MAG: flippase [Actinomycetota bacterium]
MSAARRVRKNAMLNLVGQSAPLVVAAVAIPSMMRSLGGIRFGILALTWVVAGFFNAFDLGLGRATTKFVAEATEEKSIAAIVWSAVSAQLFLGVLAGVVLWIGSDLLIGHVVRSASGIVSEAKSAFAILAFAPVLSLITASLQASLEGAERFGLVNSLRAPFTAASLLLQTLAAAFGWRLSGVVGISVGVQLVGLIVTAVICAGVFPSLRTPRIERTTLVKLLRFGGWVAVSGVAGPLLVYADRFAIAALLSVSLAGHYAATQEMVIQLSIIPASVLSALFPVFSAQRRSDDIGSLITRSALGLLMTVGPIVLAAIALSSDLLRVWLGAALSRELSAPLQILAIGILINAIAYVPYAFIQAIGRPDVTAKLHLLELPLHIGLVWFLVTRFGLIGAALAWTIRVAIDAATLFVAAAHLDRRWSLKPSRAFLVLPAIVVLAGIALVIQDAPTLPMRTTGALVLAFGTLSIWRVRARFANMAGVR